MDKSVSVFRTTDLCLRDPCTTWRSVIVDINNVLMKGKCMNGGAPPLLVRSGMGGSIYSVFKWALSSGLAGQTTRVFTYI